MTEQIGKLKRIKIRAYKYFQTVHIRHLHLSNDGGFTILSIISEWPCINGVFSVGIGEVEGTCEQ